MDGSGLQPPVLSDISSMQKKRDSRDGIFKKVVFYSLLCVCSDGFQNLFLKNNNKKVLLTSM